MTVHFSVAVSMSCAQGTRSHTIAQLSEEGVDSDDMPQRSTSLPPTRRLPTNNASWHRHGKQEHVLMHGLMAHCFRRCYLRERAR